MDFFRHSYKLAYADSTNEPQNYYQQIGEFGFLNVATKEPPTYEEFFNYDTDLYWGQDGKNQVTFRHITARYQLGRYVIKESDNSQPTYQEIFGLYNYGVDNLYYTELIFVPLKNGGFFISNLNNNKFNPTPKLNLRQVISSSRYPSFVAGIAPTNNSIVNNYAYMFGGGYYATKDYVTKIDFQNGSILDTSKYIVDTAENMTYTDINNNVCTLIKMPYNNYFLDNIYLISTAPSTLKNSTFFSFGGRNFFNVIDNIVLELPNN